MANARLATISSWSDPARDADWQSITSGTKPGTLAALQTIDAGGVPCLDELYAAFEMPRQRWRKTHELMRRYERSRRISFWPSTAPATTDAMRPIFEWLLAKPARMIAYNAMHRQEHGVDIFERYMKSIASKGPGAAGTIACALTVFGTTFAQSTTGPGKDEGDGQKECPGSIAAIAWVEANLPNISDVGALFPVERPAPPPKRKVGRPTNAERSAREEAKRQALAEANQSQPQPAPTAEVGQKVATERPSDAPSASPRTDAPQGEPAPSASDNDVEALRLEVSRKRLELEEAEALLAAALTPVSTSDLKSQLDEAWPSNGIEWPRLIPRPLHAEVIEPHRRAVMASTSIRSIDAALAAAGSRLGTSPDSLDEIIAQLSSARDERAKLIAERNGAADAIQSIAKRATDQEAAEPPGTASSASVETDPRDAKIAALTARIAELEEMASARAPVMVTGAEAEATDRQQTLRQSVAVITLQTTVSVSDNWARAQEIISEWSQSVERSVKNATHDIKIAATADGASWGLRHTHPDQRDPARTWTVEATLTLRGETLFLYAQVSTSGTGDGKVERTRPRFIKALVDLGCWSDGTLPVNADVKAIETGEQFRSLVLDPSRRLPIVVVSAANKTQRALVDEADLSAKLNGIAHVATISIPAGRNVSETLGREWSVYDGAIRIYQPTAAISSAKPSDHRYLPAAKIRAANTAALEHALRNHVLEISVAYSHGHGVTDFASIQQLQVNDVRDRLLAKPESQQSGAELRELAAMREKQVEEYAVEIKTLYELLAGESSAKLEAIAQRERSLEEAAEAQEEIRELELQMESLRAQIAKMSERQGTPVITADQVKTHDDLVRYVETGMGPHIVAIPKCIRDLRKKNTVNVPKTMEALALLSQYVAMRHKTIDFATWNEVRAKSKIEDCTYGKALGKLESYGDYAFTYLGQRFIAERHLKTGGDPDLRNTVRIYYTYDEATNRVLIARMTEHLKVESTN